MGIIRESERNSNILPLISILIKEQRVKLGLQQSELAEKVGIGLKTLRKIEQGDLSVNFKKLNYLLNCLGLSLTPTTLVSSPQEIKKVKLDKDFILTTLTHIYPLLKIKYGLNSMALFGSYALDVADEESDIDVLVDFDEALDFEKEGEVSLILENLFQGKKVDLTFKKSLRKEFIKEINRTKIDVKEKL
jgi:predicted nucleotidyltransferase/DNA-binding XRE family transcriptional regulator